jgi:hypothetical protein
VKFMKQGNGGVGGRANYESLETSALETVR